MPGYTPRRDCIHQTPWHAFFYPPPLSLCSALHHLSYRETHSSKKCRLKGLSHTPSPPAHHHHSISINDITFYRWRETISFLKCRRLKEILQEKERNAINSSAPYRKLLIKREKASDQKEKKNFISSEINSYAPDDMNFWWVNITR